MPAGFLAALSIAVIVAAVLVPLAVHFLLETPPEGQYDGDGGSATGVAGDPWAGVTERDPGSRSSVGDPDAGTCSECGADVDLDLSFCWRCAAPMDDSNE
ncbi:MAG TPA: hypothetical protein VJ898_02695 [Natrialbaceae archaeon]|nr:hypothetical protein [Natrialbaceae archaeon]